MNNKLEKIFEMQNNLNAKIGVPLWSQDKDKISEWTLKFTRALIHEVVELERELDWKHWKKSKIDIEKAKEESIDCLHFLVSIFIQLGMSPKEVTDIYESKNKVNHKRQDNGY